MTMRQTDDSFRRYRLRLYGFTNVTFPFPVTIDAFKVVPPIGFASIVFWAPVMWRLFAFVDRGPVGLIAAGFTALICAGATTYIVARAFLAKVSHETPMKFHARRLYWWLRAPRAPRPAREMQLAHPARALTATREARVGFHQHPRTCSECERVERSRRRRVEHGVRVREAVDRARAATAGNPDDATQHRDHATGNSRVLAAPRNRLRRLLGQEA